MVRRKTGKNPQSHTNRTSTSLGGGRYVSVYCRGTIDAPHEKYLIGSLSENMQQGKVFWSYAESGYAAAGADSFTPIKNYVTQWLDGNKYLHRDVSGNALRDGEPDTDVFYKESFRTAWLFRCKTCRLTDKVADPSKLYAVLTAMFRNYGESGVLEIPLSALIRVS